MNDPITFHESGDLIDRAGQISPVQKHTWRVTDTRNLARPNPLAGPALARWRRW